MIRQQNQQFGPPSRSGLKMVLPNGSSDLHCKIKETLLIRDLKPALNDNVGSEKMWSVFTAIYLSYNFYLILSSYQSS